jgi:Protein of unknown function (DUF3800)
LAHIYLFADEAGDFAFNTRGSRYFIIGSVTLLVVASALQVNRKKAVLGHAVRDVVQQVVEARSYQTAFWPAQADPRLQVADYVTWAIQRKHERGDARSYELIRNKIASEFQPFRIGSTTYY